MAIKSFSVKSLMLSSALFSVSAMASQVEIDALKQQVEQQQAQLDALTSAIERGSSSGNGWVDDTSWGGYAELHYNNISSDDDSANDKKEMDLHRFVLFFGHRFSDSVRFFSELEVEHNVAGEGKNGEVEIEQAFIQWDYIQGHSALAGVFLMPVGILNQIHEPDTFYGVERNNVEKNIIPTTWWEGGIMVSGEVMEGLSYDVAVSSGLNIDLGAGKYKIRDGRQKASEAPADELAYTTRLTWKGAAGVSVGVTAQYQTDLLQGETVGSQSDMEAILLEVHVDLQQGPFGLRALYADWNIDRGMDRFKAGADEQTGWYVEPSFKVNDSLGFFLRQSEWDNQAGDSSVDSKYKQTDAGVNYWLADTVALKADVVKIKEPNDTKKGFNLGIGWSF